MSTIDDPTIPEDLDAALRAATGRLDVSPAPLRAVAHRAQQRRRRHRTLVAAGAAAVVLVAGLGVAAVTGDRGGDEVVTASDPEPAAPATAGASVPQPLLLADGTNVLREVIPGGARPWWTTGDGWQATEGAVLADGRRFGVAYGIHGTSLGDRISLIAIADGSSPAAPEWDLAADDADVRLVGTSGNEVILRRLVTETPEPDPGLAGTPIDYTTTITAFDVDTGEERTILTDDTAGFASAAGGTLVRNFSTDCSLVVSPVVGTGPERTIDGGCPKGIPGLEGMEGLAMDLAVSPDGRYVATVWQMIRLTGSSVVQLAITDLETGTTSQKLDVSKQSPVLGLAWTSDRTVTLAAGPGEAANGDVGTVTVRLDGD